MKLRLALVLAVVFTAGLLVGKSVSSTAPPPRPDPASGPVLPAVERQAAEPVTERTGEPTAERPVADDRDTDLTEDERRDIRVFNEASPSTVFIISVALRRSFFSLDVSQVPQGSGTGFVWDSDGHIVTNFHVVQTNDPSTRYEVTLWDQTQWQAEVVGVAPGKDLAVLRIGAPREKLVPLALGRSDNLAVGQKVLALGNPFGLDQSLTTGIVSALGRDLQAPDGRTIRDVIQTDAAINPGNSGGPLLDSRGRLVGVNTAIASPSGAYAGIGFAIPVQTVRELVPQLIRFGEPIRPGIGVRVVSDYVARRNRLEGVVIEDVEPGGPAARAGLEPVRVDRRGRISGDIIVGVDGKAVRTLAELQDAFEEAGGVGARVRLTVVNAGRRRDVEVDLIKVNK